MGKVITLAIGLVLGAASMAVAGTDSDSTHSRFNLVATTADAGPEQVRFVHCPSDWDLPSFNFRFVGYDPRNDRLVLACP
jgi:hypothetical protein